MPNTENDKPMQGMFYMLGARPCRVYHNKMAAKCDRALPNSTFPLVVPLYLDNVHSGRYMRMIIGFPLFAHLDRCHPFIFQCFVDCASCLWVGIQHESEHMPTFARNKIVEWRRGWMMLTFGKSVFKVIGLEICVECRIRCLGHSPGEFLELHAVKDNGRCPHIDRPGVVFCHTNQSKPHNMDAAS